MSGRSEPRLRLVSVALAGVLACGLTALGLWNLRPDLFERIARMPPAEAPLPPQTAPPPQAESAAIAMPGDGDAEPAAPVEAASAVPRFDLVRTEPNGSMLVAGRAAPGATVRIVVDGATAGEAMADATGSFVTFLVRPASDAAQLVWLIAEGEGGRLAISDDRVIVAARNSLDGVPANAATIAGLPAASAVARTDPSGAGEQAGTQTGRPEAETPEEAAALSAGTDRAPPTTGARVTSPDASSQPVLLSDAAGVRLMSPPPLPDAAGLRIDTIDYAAGDAVVLRGRSAAPGAVRLSFDGLAVATVIAGRDGLWQARVRVLPPGDYTLTAERLDAAGGVAATVAVPFRRAAPEAIAAAASDAEARAVTVQPGATLWAIARDRYGDPMHYVHVFETNSHQIGHPDLIFPGQVFDLPDPPPAPAPAE